MVYRDQQHKIQTTNRPTNILTCTIKSSLISLNSTPYSQALRINTIRSTTSEFNKNNEIIIKRPKERRYPKNLVVEQVDNVKNIKSKQLLLTNNEKRIQNCIPVSITYNIYVCKIYQKLSQKIRTLCKYH